MTTLSTITVRGRSIILNIKTFDPVTILGVDPGNSTGVVVANYLKPTELPTITYAETILYDTIIPDLIKILDCHKPDVVVVEDFAVRRSKALGLSFDRLEVVRVIGIVKALTFLRSLPMILQRPVDVSRSLVEDEMKKELRHHERSAYKHIKYYYFTKFITN